MSSAGLSLAQTSPHAGMLRFPDISKDAIAFVYANDVWITPREGGLARPLSSPAGVEMMPKFSPDGSTIAFVGNYDGNQDIYTMPVAPASGEGLPTRVTFHPANEMLCDWTPGGKLMFYSNGWSGLQRQQQLWTVDAKGGMPERLPVPYGAFASISPDASTLAYIPHTTDFRTWKRYRGGMATDIWTLNLGTKASKRITEWEGNDTAPMFLPGSDGSVIYFLTDQGPEHRMNLWKFAVASGAKEQVTKYADFDVKWPSTGPGTDGKGEIIFQVGPELRVLNLGTGGDKVVTVTIPGDRPTIRPRMVDASKNIGSVSLSPSGKRVALAARGDIWSAPAKEGSVRALTKTSGLNERDPSWSPDGKYLAFFSDESGEYELYVRPSDARPEEEKKDEKKDDGAGEPAAADANTNASNSVTPAKALTLATRADAGEIRKLTTIGAGYRSSPVWSPDSKKIVTTDDAGRFWFTTLSDDGGAGETVTIDQDPWSSASDVSWSHDSNWIAYAKSDTGNNNQCVWLYDVKGKQATQVTSNFFASRSPAFDRKGELLYFVSARHFEEPIYSDIDSSFVYTGSSQLYAVPLRKDVKNPLGVKSDEEEIKADKKDKPKDDAKKDDEKKDGEKNDDASAGKADEKKDEKKEDKKDDKPLVIDLEGFESRAIILAPAVGSFSRLEVSHDGKLVYGRSPARGSDAKESIKIYDLAAEEKDRKEETVFEGGAFELSADGKKILANKEGKWHVGDVGKDAKLTPIPTDGMMQTVNPREEWAQVFDDTRRIFRDYFYEPTMHGVDWQALHVRYKAMLADCTSREDVAFVQAEFVSELNVGHAYITSPGDVQDVARVGVGLLGVDFSAPIAMGDASAYKIDRIYTGAAWDADARGPLSQPGVDVKAGEYLLAVNGERFTGDAARNVYAAFIDTAGKATTLTVGPNPMVDDKARDVVVKPVGNESTFRFRAWIERNRKYVSEKSSGRVGYIYVPNTGTDGQNELFRQFFGQRHMDALIIDDRWNGGGQIPTRFIELLSRKPTNYWALRHGNDWPWPPDAHFGPKCMLINGLAGSGGDAFPGYFKQAGIGKLIGMRTWGGLVGISGNPGLIDGGSIAVPTFGYYKLDGTWGIEGHGVDPDMEVIDDPGMMQNYHALETTTDPQLDAAIGHMEKELLTNAYKKPARPQSPDRKGMGIPKEQR